MQNTILASYTSGDGDSFDRQLHERIERLSSTYWMPQ